MSRKRYRSNIRKFRRMPDLNIGFLTFIVIFIYVIVSVIIFTLSEKTTIYEVNAGALATDTSYTGLIVRDESLVTSTYAGTLNYFVKSKDRVGMKSLIYTVDETGRVADKINAAATQSLSDDDLDSIRNVLSEYSMNYDAMNYDEIYTAGNSVTDLLNEFKVDNIIDDLDGYITDTDDKDFFHKITATATGLVDFSYDGYEDLKESDLQSSLFEESNYKQTTLQNGALINVGDIAYKIIQDDSWFIYIQLDDTQAASYQDTSEIDLTFSDSGITTKADFTLVTIGKSTYGKISLNRYLINFINERFVKIDIGDMSHTGLKIPSSSVFKKNFYTIPKEYLTNSDTFIRKTYAEDGSIVTDSVDATIYEEDDTYCYVSMKEFSTGDIIAKADSDDTFVVGTIGELSGVYCVNRGYAVFRKVDIIGHNSEYYVVKRGTSFGLSIYDHIVLDYKTVEENELVN